MCGDRPREFPQWPLLTKMTNVPLPIQRDETGENAGVVTVFLEQEDRPLVVMDLGLLQRIEATIQALPNDVAGLVLASKSSRAFVAGADLKTISEWEDDQLDKYIAFGARILGSLSQLPYPTVAAINGAALGGGLELAMHCDGLVASPPAGPKPYPVGLPEAGLGLCPGWGGTNLLPARMDPAAAIEHTALGKIFLYEQAVEASLFDAIAPDSDGLLETAKQWLAKARAAGTPERDGAPSRWIGRPGTASKVLAGLDEIRSKLPETECAAAVVNAIDAGLTRGWQPALDTERGHLVRLRHTETAKNALAAFFARTGAGPKK